MFSVHSWRLLNVPGTPGNVIWPESEGFRGTIRPGSRYTLATFHRTNFISINKWERSVGVSVSHSLSFYLLPRRNVPAFCRFDFGCVRGKLLSGLTRRVLVTISCRYFFVSFLSRLHRPRLTTLTMDFTHTDFPLTDITTQIRSLTCFTASTHSFAPWFEAPSYPTRHHTFTGSTHLSRTVCHICTIKNWTLCHCSSPHWHPRRFVVLVVHRHPVLCPEPTRVSG